MKKLNEVRAGEFFMFTDAPTGAAKVFECTEQSRTGATFKPYGGTYGSEQFAKEGGKLFNAEVYTLQIDGHEKRGDYQIQASQNGWRGAIGQILRNVTHSQAVTIAYGFALAYGNEARAANITGYDNAGERNAAGESLGNGIYCHCSNAYNYLRA